MAARRLWWRSLTFRRIEPCSTGRSGVRSARMYPAFAEATGDLILFIASKMNPQVFGRLGDGLGFLVVSFAAASANGKRQWQAPWQGRQPRELLVPPHRECVEPTTSKMSSTSATVRRGRPTGRPGGASESIPSTAARGQGSRGRPTGRPGGAQSQYPLLLLGVKGAGWPRPGAGADTSRCLGAWRF